METEFSLEKARSLYGSARLMNPGFWRIEKGVKRPEYTLEAIEAEFKESKGVNIKVRVERKTPAPIVATLVTPMLKPVYRATVEIGNDKAFLFDTSEPPKNQSVPYYGMRELFDRVTQVKAK